MRNRGHSRTPDPLHHTRTRYSEPGPPHPHVNPLIPNPGDPAHMRNSGFTCGTEDTAVHQTRYITREPAIPSLGLLIRT